MRFYYFAATAALSVLGSIVQAGSNSGSRTAYTSIDTSITASGVTIKGDGNAFTAEVSYISPNNNIGAMLSFTTQNGALGTATYSASTVSLGVGYEIIDTRSNLDSLGTSVVLGLGFSSTTGEATISGTEYDLKTDQTPLFARIDGDVTESLRLFASFNYNVDGESDPTVGAGVAFDIFGNSAISVGYDSNKSTASGVTTETTGWSLGWVTTF